MPWWNPFAAARGNGVVVPPRLTVDERTKEEQPGSTLQPWQRKAWEFYGMLGEVHYASGFYARMLSGVRLYVEELGRPDVDPAAGTTETGPDEWQESSNQDLIASLTRLENSTGGMARLQGDAGRLIFVQGEGQLTRTLTDPAGNGELVEHWEMLSAAELAYNRVTKEYTRARGSGMGSFEKIKETDPDDPQPDTMMAWRFYHRDPQFSGMADSSLRAVLDDLDELVLLKQSIRNMARSRAGGNGILVMPNSMGGNEVDAGDGTKVPKNALAIYQALTTPIQNEKAASAVSPVVLFAPDGTTSSDIFHVDLRGAALYRESGLRDECIRRIAIGLDMPPEELTGMSVSNHWTAWQITDASWTNHGDPMTRELVGFLTAVLLAPVARELGLDPTRVRVWYDPTDVVQDPDRGRSAQDAHDRLIISDEAARRDMGYDEDDAPDDTEWQRRASIGRKPGASTVGDSPPAQGQAGTSPERIIGMAEGCVLRCRELAGSKLRTRMQAPASPANLRVRIKNAPNVEVACALGADVIDECDPDALVAGAGQVFLQGLRRLGLNQSLAETLVRRVEEFAASTLFQPDPGPLPDEVLAICALASMRK